MNLRQSCRASTRRRRVGRARSFSTLFFWRIHRFRLHAVCDRSGRRQTGRRLFRLLRFLCFAIAAHLTFCHHTTPVVLMLAKKARVFKQCALISARCREAFSAILPCSREPSSKDTTVSAQKAKARRACREIIRRTYEAIVRVGSNDDGLSVRSGRICFRESLYIRRERYTVGCWCSAALTVLVASTC